MVKSPEQVDRERTVLERIGCDEWPPQLTIKWGNGGKIYAWLERTSKKRGVYEIFEIWRTTDTDKHILEPFTQAEITQVDLSKNPGMVISKVWVYPPLE